jgi:hypothetical protein
MFAAISNFKKVSKSLHAAQLVQLLNSVYSSFDFCVKEPKFEGKVYKVEVRDRSTPF